MQEAFNFSERVLSWFDQHGRKTLPWQKHITPYRVWVSEIMLQQTQVKTVIPYFKRFIKRFPSVKALAYATEEEVLTFWSGLGYYARGRNLHKTAQIIQQQFGGQFPLDLQALQSLPGIGRSTAGAILAIAGNQRAVILDANVKRVLTRFHGIAEWSDQKNTFSMLWEIAEQCTPLVRVADYTQAMMDLGALVCTKKPQCKECPLAESCVALQSDTITLYPAKKPKLAPPVRSTTMLILQDADQILLKKRMPVGIWGGLWSFPESDLSADEIKEWLPSEFSCDLEDISEWPPFRHTFSHFHLDIKPLVAKVKKNNNLIREDQVYLWYTLTDPLVAVPAPVKKIIDTLTAVTTNRS
jgi:A/G-specific adenine glycosylase